jgi:predicted N-acyltransferase
MMQTELIDYGIRVHLHSSQRLPPRTGMLCWSSKHSPTPFMQHAYLLAIARKFGSAIADTGWQYAVYQLMARR